MLQPFKPAGDAGYIAEELLPEAAEWLRKSRIVEKAVTGGYYDLPKALSLYGVTESEYVIYQMLINKRKMTAGAPQLQLTALVNVIVSVFMQSEKTLDPKGKAMVNKLEELVH